MRFLMSEEFYLNFMQFSFLVACGYTFSRSDMPLWGAITLLIILSLAVAHYHWQRRRSLIDYVDKTLNDLRYELFKEVGPFSFSEKLNKTLSKMERKQEERFKKL